MTANVIISADAGDFLQRGLELGGAKFVRDQVAARPALTFVHVGRRFVSVTNGFCVYGLDKTKVNDFVLAELEPGAYTLEKLKGAYSLKLTEQNAMNTDAVLQLCDHAHKRQLLGWPPISLTCGQNLGRNALAAILYPLGTEYVRFGGFVAMDQITESGVLRYLNAEYLGSALQHLLPQAEDRGEPVHCHLSSASAPIYAASGFMVASIMPMRPTVTTEKIRHAERDD